MKLTLLEAVHGISAAGQAKEQIRAGVQALIQQAVLDGRVTTQEELDELHAALDMSLKALKMVPLQAWLGNDRPKSKRR